MKTPELKLTIHELVDQIENERFLTVLCQILKTQSGHQQGKLWDGLSPQQQEEVLQAFEESEEPYQLVPKENIFKKD